jgi:putative DNA primase/helicase
MITGDTLKSAHVRWIWKDVIPRDCITLLSGSGGTGKSTVAISFIANITTGKPWPDGTLVSEGKVLIIHSPEDDLTSVWVPRLKAAGANMKNIVFDKANNGYRLDKRLKKLSGVKLVLIDPMVAIFGHNFHNEIGARNLMDDLTEIAADNSMSILGIVHTNKKGDASGSKTLLNVARAAWMTEPYDDTSSIMKPIKFNLGPTGKGLMYQIIKAADGEFETSKAIFEGWVELDRDDMLGEKSGRITEAMEFLRVELQYGPLPAASIKIMSNNAGFGWRTVEKAKKKLNIKSIKSGDNWEWVIQDRKKTQF